MVRLKIVKELAGAEQATPVVSGRPPSLKAAAPRPGSGLGDFFQQRIIDVSLGTAAIQLVGPEFVQGSIFA